jgi:hypothetical protein
VEPLSTGGAAKAASELLHSLFGVFRVGRDVRVHDTRARRIYEDLTTWARDEVAKQREEQRRVDEQLAARGIFRSGSRDAQHRRIHEEFARRWRDRKRQAERDLEDLRLAETWLHALYRRVRKRPWPQNPHQAEVDNISRAWEGWV